VRLKANGEVKVLWLTRKTAGSGGFATSHLSPFGRYRLVFSPVQSNVICQHATLMFYLNIAFVDKAACSESIADDFIGGLVNQRDTRGEPPKADRRTLLAHQQQ